MLATNDGIRSVACHFSFEEDEAPRLPAANFAQPPPDAGRVPLLEVKEIVKSYPVRRYGVRKREWFRAVDQVSFEIGKGESFGLVGETGSGKTTIARLVLGLAGKATGVVSFDGHVLSLSGRRKAGWSDGEIQVVFQDPDDSLNPQKSVGQSIGEPLSLVRRFPSSGKGRRISELMNLVGLDDKYVSARPGSLSGGQKQRVAIARALATNPKLVICDEAVSSLDVSVRAQILNLLKRIQRELGVSYLFITHDLAVVRHVCDRVAVLYRGGIVELSDVDSLFTAPQHPYTVALLSAVPRLDPDAAEAPPPERLPSAPTDRTGFEGCRFRERCWKAQGICRGMTPPLIDRGPGHASACHFPENSDELAHSSAADVS